MDYIIDAKNKKLGRLASEIAVILQGKKSPNYDPRLPGKDRVVVKNVEELSIETKKGKQKIYYRHTGYMGHLKKITLEQAFLKDPKKVLLNAVRKMLPKNSLQKIRIKNIIFDKSE